MNNVKLSDRGGTFIEVIMTATMIMCIIGVFLQVMSSSIKINSDSRWMVRQNKALFEFAKVISEIRITAETSQEEFAEIVLPRNSDAFNYHMIIDGKLLTTGNPEGIDEWAEHIEVKSDVSFTIPYSFIVLAVTDKNDENEAVCVAYY